MHQNDGSRVMGNCPFYNFSRVNRGLVLRATKQLLKGQHPMPIVQIEATEDLMRSTPEQGGQVVPGVQRAGQLRPGSKSLTALIDWVGILNSLSIRSLPSFPTGCQVHSTI